VILVIVTGIVIYKVDFHHGNFNAETETLYAFFLGLICTLIIVTSFALIYKKKTAPEIEVQEQREKFPIGCMAFIAGFVSLVVYCLYISVNFRY
jgi:amino acid transporter